MYCKLCQFKNRFYAFQKIIICEDNKVTFTMKKIQINLRIMEIKTSCDAINIIFNIKLCKLFSAD